VLKVMESNNFSRIKIHQLDLYNRTGAQCDGNTNHNVLFSEIDYLQGRNEELRAQLNETRKENARTQSHLTKAQEDLEKFNENIKTLKKSGVLDGSVQGMKLPNGITQSSKDIISALNEYLVDALQVKIFNSTSFLLKLIFLKELDEYKNVNSEIEKELEKLKRKYVVQRHQLSLLYKDHLEEIDKLKNDNNNLMNENQKLNDQINIETVKLQEFQVI
jgi:predicted  nucleic acid-binding Zn-ribbon protein